MKAQRKKINRIARRLVIPAIIIHVAWKEYKLVRPYCDDCKVVGHEAGTIYCPWEVGS